MIGFSGCGEAVFVFAVCMFHFLHYSTLKIIKLDRASRCSRTSFDRSCTDTDVSDKENEAVLLYAIAEVATRMNQKGWLH
ncbi:hypothetical protein D7M11_26890 [Paenibacillus ginsengarvi]|uniref:Uncharacterized protein n=1 Tax=Paenibacillus ginsengarvi TaxID=400777 RepID=A0A3B0BTE9_9BACL|nr:hypothetical protein D7M11_26890 [Paenibacillus ginsengarvi]